jgi:hypothetical protein
MAAVLAAIQQALIRQRLDKAGLAFSEITE